MRRAAAGLGIVLLLALATIGGAAFWTARPADSALWPPRPDGSTIEISVISNGYHAGLAPSEAQSRLRWMRIYWRISEFSLP